jgi:ankyrin repeat protein
VNLLLSHGADVNAKDKFGLTPLHWATLHDNEVSADVLLAHGADVNAKDDEVGNTPLIIAAGQGYEDVTKLLLAKGADVNASDNKGTPLAWAMHTGHNKIAGLLRQQGGHE